MKMRVTVLASALLAMVGMSNVVSAEESMYVPIPSYRVGHMRRVVQATSVVFWIITT